MSERLERRLQRGLDNGDMMPVHVIEAADTLKRYREALRWISEHCPATCDMTLAHEMAGVADDALSDS